MLKEVNDATFQSEVLENDLPVLVDFWAPWCGPCRALTPRIEELAEEYDGKAAIVKLNTDESPATKQEYKVFSIPTLLLFKGGELLERQSGLKSKTELKALLQKAL